VESETVRQLREGYEAFNRGDYEAASASLADDFRLENLNSLDGSIESREAARAWMEPDIFDLQNSQPQSFDDRGSRVLAEVVVSVRGRESGLETQQRWLHVWDIDLEARRVTRLRGFSVDHRAEAEAALAEAQQSG
jgi:ketosteroid isomerase-like protein